MGKASRHARARHLDEERMAKYKSSMSREIENPMLHEE